MQITADVQYDSSSIIRTLGPQRDTESKLARRTRFHQSWYRSQVLNLANYGSTPGEKGRRLGSILSDIDAEQGLNFTSLAAWNLYRTRRKLGWGVDPVRCTKYLTSSQALTLNLFGPLASSPEWFTEVLRDGYGMQHIEQVESLLVEYAPRRRSLHLGDSTRIDALVQFQSKSGPGLLAIEVKYADRFNSRIINIDNAHYRQAFTTTGIWRQADSLSNPSVNQLLRCHALAASAMGFERAAHAKPVLLVLHHKDDRKGEDIVEEYRQTVTDPETVRSATLTDFINMLGRHTSRPADKLHCENLIQRYVNEELSETLWNQYLNHHPIHTPK